MDAKGIVLVLYCAIIGGFFIYLWTIEKKDKKK